MAQTVETVEGVDISLAEIVSGSLLECCNQVQKGTCLTSAEVMKARVARPELRKISVWTANFAM